jgi:hypothetical protein
MGNVGPRRHGADGVAAGARAGSRAARGLLAIVISESLPALVLIALFRRGRWKTRAI